MIRDRLRLLRVACCAAIVLAAAAEAAAQNCDANHTIRWPESNPLWALCWTAPPESSGIDGSGLEISNVRYRGNLVLGRGHTPVLNVLYDPGGCGGPERTYRDWVNELVRFEANNVIRPGYAEPTAPVRTVCDTPGQDVGLFTGVAAEKLADRLILTTQIEAGWYRYVLSWTFFLDGTIKPGIRFTAVDNVCTPLAHYHNAYWRLDFDLDGLENDAIEELNGATWSTLATETKRVHAPATGRMWRVRDKTTGTAYEIVPKADADVADAWGVADMWALRFRAGEEDDGGSTPPPNADRAHMDRYLTGEAIDAADVVMWYRDGFRHEGPADCEFGGPTLRPVRAPAAVVTANGQQSAVTLGAADPLRIDLAFDAGDAGFLSQSEVYFGVAAPSGVFFVDPAVGFVPFPARLYGGPLAAFGPTSIVNLPAAGVLPPGTYVWFAIVDADSDGTIDGTFFNYVVTIIGS